MLALGFSPLHSCLNVTLKSLILLFFKGTLLLNSLQTMIHTRF